MTKSKVATANGMLIACPDCDAAGQIDATGVSEGLPLAHTEACPQNTLPLKDRMYTVTVLA